LETGRFCGHFRGFVPGFPSPSTLSVFVGDFRRPVSAAKNSVPGGTFLISENWKSGEGKRAVKDNIGRFEFVGSINGQ
jgi:hypothetical protein